jgi:hypothetical protein
MKIVSMYNGIFLGKEGPFYDGPPTFCLWPRKGPEDKEVDEWARKLAEFTGWKLTRIV